MELVKEMLAEIKQELSWLARPKIGLTILFLIVFIANYMSNSVIPGDSMWSVPTAMSIINEGNTDLDEYKESVKERDNFAIETIDNHLYTIFPVGTSILAVPFVYIYDKYLGIVNNTSLDKEFSLYFMFVVFYEHFIASIIVAATALVIYLIGRKYLGRNWSLLLTFIFTFCSSTWSVAGRLLLQHGPSMLMLSLTLYLILLSREKPHLIQFSSIPLSFSYVIRPTNSLSVFFLSVYIFVTYRRFFFKYILWGLLIIVPFIGFNLSVYHNVLSGYYLPQRIGTNPQFTTALIANLISPGRGLFYFSPVFLFSLIGMGQKIKENTSDKLLDYTLVIILILHLLVISSFGHWVGGWSYGPRFFSDMIPYLTYFLIPFLLKIQKLDSVKTKMLMTTLSITILFSFYVHYRGATFSDSVGRIEMNPNKVWSWTNPPFMGN